MACPKCGGAKVREITPGYFECQSEVVAAVAPPEVTGVGLPQPIYEVCGHRFQTDTPMATEPCACGRYSIGRCVDCARPLCGLHAPHDGPVLCDACTAKRQGIARAEAEINDLDAARSALAHEQNESSRQEAAVQARMDRAAATQRSAVADAIRSFLAEVGPSKRTSYTVGFEERTTPGGLFRKPVTTRTPIKVPAYEIFRFDRSDDGYGDHLALYVLASGHVVFTDDGRASVSCSFTGEPPLKDRTNAPDGLLPFNVSGAGSMPNAGAPKTELTPSNLQAMGIEYWERNITETTAWFLKELARFLRP